MFGSLIVYSGIVIATLGLALVIRPIRRFRIIRHLRGWVVGLCGVVLTFVGLILPVTESPSSRATTRLDEFAPRWQFREHHSLRVDAPAERVFEAIKQVRADEIFLFHALTWIRRGGQWQPESILNAGNRESLIEVATRSGFVILAEDVPRELVIGTVVMAPTGTRGLLTPQTFQMSLPPGFALATMNFLVAADGPNASFVSTETRVFANSDTARRRFAVYWRVIYPGSAIIRRMWLRAIQKRASEPQQVK